MALTLGQKQKLFMRLLPRLIDYMHEQGYEVSQGDGFRDPRAYGEPGETMVTADGQKVYGRRYSCHKFKLAKDLNLYKDGVYLTKTSDHRKCGEFWESLHELCVWGGANGNNDGNHYSLSHEGRW